VNVKDLLIQIMLIFCLSVSAVSATNPHITATTNINPGNFWSLDSEQSPSKGTVDIILTGSGDPVALPVEAVLAIDSSGSMSTNDPDTDRLAAAVSFVNIMSPDEDTIGLVSWDDNIDFEISPTSNFEEVTTGIYKVDSEGNTDLDEGLNTAIDIMNDDDRVFKTIVFLSDGDGSYTQSGNSGSPADRARQMGIVVYTIGLNVNGKPVEEKLKDIATTTGGKYYDATDSSSLKSFYEEIGKAVLNIAGRDVMVRYAVPKNAIIDNYKINKPREIVEGSTKVLTWNVGTMSIGEKWKTSFDVSFMGGGVYTLGAAPYSKVDYAKYDGTSGNQAILGHEVMVSEAGTFALTGKGFGGSNDDPETKVTVIKEIIPNAEATCPDIKLTVQMPPNEYYIDVVFALDTSASIEYLGLAPVMTNAVMGLLKSPVFKERGVRVSIVSWDEGPADLSTPLTHVVTGNDRWIRDNFTRLNNLFGEMDRTNYGDGLEEAIAALDEEPPKTADSYVTRRIIVFVTGESEFTPGDWERQIDIAKDKGYIVYTAGLKIDEQKTPEQYRNLNMSSKTGGHFNPIDDISEIEGVIEKITTELKNLPVADNVILTDTLYPYLLVGKANVDVPEDTNLDSIYRNTDGSTTLVWNLHSMSGGRNKTLTIHPSLMISIPADVNSEGRKEEIYGIDGTTLNSNLRYNWLVGSNKGSRGPIKLPKGEIRINCGMPLEKPSTWTAPAVEPEPVPVSAEEPVEEESNKIPGFETVISISGILAAVYAFRRR